MRILNNDTDKKIDQVTLFLNAAELRQLIGYAKQLIEKPSEDHFHLSSEDYQKEITICIYNPDTVQNFDSRSQKLLNEDI